MGLLFCLSETLLISLGFRASLILSLSFIKIIIFILILFVVKRLSCLLIFKNLI